MYETIILTKFYIIIINQLKLNIPCIIYKILFLLRFMYSHRNQQNIKGKMGIGFLFSKSQMFY